MFRLEQAGQDRADLQRILGVGRGRVSEILNRRRGLSLAMIRNLVDSIRLPADVLIQPTKSGVWHNLAADGAPTAPGAEDPSAMREERTWLITS